MAIFKNKFLGHNTRKAIHRRINFSYMMPSRLSRALANQNFIQNHSISLYFQDKGNFLNNQFLIPKTPVYPVDFSHKMYSRLGRSLVGHKVVQNHLAEA